MKALIRADASVQIGMGHRVRCQALIAAFQVLGWQCKFVVHRDYAAFTEPNDLLIDREQDFLRLAQQSDLVILDHYQYKASDIAELYAYQANLLVLDDMNDRGDFPARWVLNPLAEEYSNQVIEPLTGPHYALLRPEFSTSSQPCEPLKTQANKLLITLGGTDPLALTLPILESLSKRGFPLQYIQILLGKNASNAAAVKAFAKQYHVDLEQGLTDVTPLMKSAQMAISAAGGTLFELAATGVPTVFAQVADNQTRSLQQHVPLGWCQSVRFDTLAPADIQPQVDVLVEHALTLWGDHEWQQRSSKLAQSLVDGNGASRVARHIHQAMNGCLE